MTASDEPTEAQLKPLDPRELQFVEHYVRGGRVCTGNALRSALRAGYARSTAECNAGAWIHPNGPKPHVAYRIRLLADEVAALSVMTPEELTLEASKLAFSSVSAFTRVTSSGDPYIDLSDMTEDEWAAVSQIEIEEYKEGRGEDAVAVKRVKVKQYDKIAAMNLLSKIFGMQKTVLSNDPNNPLPGSMLPGNVVYDLNKLTLGEAEQLQMLLAKALVTRDEPVRPTIDGTATRLPEA